MKFPIPQAKFDKNDKVKFAFNTDEISETGVLGDATKHDKEKGKEFWICSTEELKEIIEELRKRLT